MPRCTSAREIRRHAIRPSATAPYRFRPKRPQPSPHCRRAHSGNARALRPLRLRARNVSTNAQCVVTRLPFAGPAAVSSNAPVQTLVTHFAPSETCAIHSSSGLFRPRAACPVRRAPAGCRARRSLPWSCREERACPWRNGPADPLSDQEDIMRSRIAGALRHLVGHGENFPWSDEIQLLGIVENQNADLQCHGAPRCCEFPRIS